MPSLPKATTKVLETAGIPAGGLDVVCVMSPVGTNPDITPRLLSAQAIFDQHGYSEGLEYAALHISKTRKGVLFIGLPIATAGVLSRRNNDGHTGTSNVSVVADAAGCLAEHDGVLEVVKGGIVGVDQIVLGFSLDERTFQKLRVGTGNSIAIPYIGVTINLGAGTLVTGDTILSWHGTAPLSDSTSQDLARQRLAQQQKSFRSIMLIGDLPSHTEAAVFRDLLNTYETLNQRFTYGRASISDRLPLSKSSSVRHLTAGASLTFAAAGHTITRAAGSFATDDIATGDLIYCSGSASNNGALGKASTVTATVITFAAGLSNEGPTSAATITSRISLTYAAAGQTITRNRGSWIDEGFKVGQIVSSAGTASNNFAGKTLSAVTATVITFAAGSGIVDELIGIGIGIITQVLTKGAWLAAQDTEYSVIDAAPRISLSAGRGRVLSPFSQWNFRRPASWAASIREYQHDLHIPPWFKQVGPTDFDLFDEEGNLAEWDDRIDGEAASAARFTSFTTWANGPTGAFIAQSLTRASEGSLRVHTHNLAVVNLIQTIVQLNTEDAAIGASLVLNDDGTATADSLSTIQKRVNDALELGVLVNAQGEGQRASKAVCTIDPTTVFNVPDPTMLTTTDTNLNGTVHDVNNSIKIRSGGQ